jgi:hypothetical protein
LKQWDRLKLESANETKDEALPKERPTVITMRLLCPSLWPNIHETEESDCHKEFSPWLLPKLKPDVDWLWLSPAPCKVNMKEPELGIFAPYEALKVKNEYDSNVLLLPMCSPTVIPTLLLYPSPSAASPRTEDPDSHTVDSLELPPRVNIEEKWVDPKPIPRNVTIKDPVEKVFEQEIKLFKTVKYEKAAVIDPETLETVMDIRELVLVPCVLKPCVELSDSQALPSQELRKPRIFKEMLSNPKPDPWSVSRTAPLCGVFIPLIELTETWWKEMALDMVFEAVPILKAARTLPTKLCTPRQATVESDIQKLVSDEEKPTEIDADEKDNPSPAPASERLAEPVAAIFCLERELKISESPENTWDKEPERAPRDKEICRLLVMDIGTRQEIEVSSIQTLDSEEDIPCLSQFERLKRLKPVPRTEMLIAPDEGAFEHAEKLTVWRENDSADDRLPIVPAVTDKRRDPPTPAPALHLKAESENHWVFSHVVSESRNDTVNEAIPNPEPKIEKLDEPEDLKL